MQRQHDVAPMDLRHDIAGQNDERGRAVPLSSQRAVGAARENEQARAVAHRTKRFVAAAP